MKLFIDSQIKYKIRLTNINEIQSGDIVEIDGKLITICNNSIKYDPFMGRTLRGDNYRNGTLPVRQAIIMHVSARH